MTFARHLAGVLLLVVALAGFAVLWEHSRASTLVTGEQGQSQLDHTAHVKQLIQERQQLGIAGPKLRRHGFELSHLRQLERAVMVEVVIAAFVIAIDLIRRAGRRRRSARRRAASA